MGASPRAQRLASSLAALALATLPAASARTQPSPSAPLEAEQERALRWSATILGTYQAIDPPFENDGRAGYFDQYQFTPNKDSGAPIELGVSELRLDWIEERAPLLQLRFESPTSNLGVSGSDFDDAFFNQRALLLAQRDALRLRVDYRRLRTEPLRIFPDTTTGGGALPFTDLTGRKDRFHRERTGFRSSLRWRALDSLHDPPPLLSWLAPELSLRGGLDRREERRQLRTLLNPGNDWLALSQRRGDEVMEVGGGLLLAPGGLLTLTLDADHQAFESDDARLDDRLPLASTGRSLGFVPSTERNTGRLRLHARIGERAVVTAGFQASVLEQDGSRTPAQNAAGFDTTEIAIYSAQISGDLQLTRKVDASAFVKLVHRDRDIDQSTALFNPRNGSQVDERVDSYQRLDLGAETRFRAHRKARFAGGLRLLWIDRDIDFATRGLANRVILPANALVERTSLMWTLYGRADLRPLPGLGIRAELSYRDAPETGYVTDLGGYFRGELRSSYVLPLARPATLSLFASGGSGKNSDFSMVEGLGPGPSGRQVSRDYERAHWNLGITSDLVLRDDLTLFASFFYARDQQSDDLQLSIVQRYFQESLPLTFRTPGSLDFQSDELGIVLGGQLWLSERSDVGLSYSYTRARADYGESGGARELQLIDDNRIVDAEVHGLGIELRHQLRAGLRVFASYRLQHFEDGAPRPGSPSSVRQPPDRSEVRHTIGLGVTLDSELFREEG